MFFSLTNSISDNNTIRISSVRHTAYRRALLYEMTANATLMNNYLQNKFNKSLKQICKELILNNLVINFESDKQTVIVSFNTTASDKLASLITYGNSEVPGCSILQFAFDQYK